MMGVEDEFDIYEELQLDSFTSLEKDDLSPATGEGEGQANAASSTPDPSTEPKADAAEAGQTPTARKPPASSAATVPGISAIGKPQANPVSISIIFLSSIVVVLFFASNSRTFRINA